MSLEHRAGVDHRNRDATAVKATLILAVAMIWLLLPTHAFAAAFEPNDDIGTAIGPLLGEMSYSGALETEQDEDWFWVPIAGQQQIDFSAVFNGAGCWLEEGHAHARLLDSAGKELTDFYAISQGEDGRPQEFHYTTPPEARAYYVQFYGAGGSAELCSYSFQISPATAISAAPAQNPVVRLGEPDNFKSVAHGPIAGEVLYAGSMETAGDIDQMYLETNPGQHLKLEVAAYGCGFSGGISGVITPLGGQAIYNELGAEDEGKWDGTELETNGGGRVYVAISGDAGCDWQFWASPASALSTQPPAPVPHADPCADARRALSAAKRRIHSLSRRLHHVTSARGRGRLHHQIEARRRAARDAEHGIHAHCT